MCLCSFLYALFFHLYCWAHYHLNCWAHYVNASNSPLPVSCPFLYAPSSFSSLCHQRPKLGTYCTSCSTFVWDLLLSHRSHSLWWSDVPSNRNPDSCKTVLAIVTKDTDGFTQYIQKSRPDTLMFTSVCKLHLHQTDLLKYVARSYLLLPVPIPSCPPDDEKTNSASSER